MTLFPRIARLVFATLCLASTGHATTPLPAAPSVPDLPRMETDGQIVWGRLLTPSQPTLFGYFSAWAQGSAEGSPRRATLVNLDDYLTNKQHLPVMPAPNGATGNPEAVLKTGAQGENFQGVSLSLARVDAGGRPGALQPWSTGIGAGERFKIRVLASFDAVIVLGTSNAKGKYSQVYPAQAGTVVVARVGEVVWLPLGEKAHLQFAGDPGLNPLTLTVRDPRSLEAGRSASGKAYGQDDSQASLFLQETPPEHYPAITVVLPTGPRGPAAP